MRITALSTISYQPTFRNKGYSSVLAELTETSRLITPDYSELIPAMDRRRMSDVLKMSIACSIDCLDQAGIKQPDAIIVGTSMGCCTHTRNFLDKITSANGGLISPTSFILSTHNTIAGQISLLLKNHNYNMTHTQNSLSFEQALMDAQVCLTNGCDNVLIGGADEMEEVLFNMILRLNNPTLTTAFGASFFILSNTTTDTPTVSLVDSGSYGLIKGISEHVLQFLQSNKLSAHNIDVVLYSNSTSSTVHELQGLFGQRKLLDFQKFCGTWLSNSAFAMSYAVDRLLNEEHPLPVRNTSTVLVCNNLIPENLGLILLAK